MNLSVSTINTLIPELYFIHLKWEFVVENMFKKYCNYIHWNPIERYVNYLSTIDYIVNMSFEIKHFDPLGTS